MIQSIEDLLNDDGITSKHLDEIVIDAASTQASLANNKGKHGQIDYLIMCCGWSEDDIVCAVNEFVFGGEEE